MSTFKVAFIPNEHATNFNLQILQQIHSFHRITLPDDLPQNHPKYYQFLYDYIDEVYMKHYDKYNDNELSLRYIDDENDICEITSNAELLEAIRQVTPKIVKIYIASSTLSNTSMKSSDAILMPSVTIPSGDASDIELEVIGSPFRHLSDDDDDDSDFVELNKGDYENNEIESNETISRNSSATATEAKSILTPTNKEEDDGKEEVYTEMLDLRSKCTPTRISSNLSAISSVTAVAPVVHTSDLANDEIETTTPFRNSNFEMDFDETTDRFDTTKTKISDTTKRTDAYSSSPIPKLATVIEDEIPALVDAFTQLSACSSPSIAAMIPTLQTSITPTVPPTKESSQHVTSSIISTRTTINNFKTQAATSYFCRNCSSMIAGTFYRCIYCHKYNLCNNCEAKFQHPIRHPLIKIRDSNIADGALKCAKISAHQYLRFNHPEYMSAQRQTFASPAISQLNATIFNADHSDHFRVNLGENVTKLWTVVNSGQVVWPVGTQLRFHGGTIALASNVQDEKLAIDLPPLLPGKRVNLSILIMIADEVGEYQGSFRLCTREGISFGQNYSFEVTVEDAESESIPNGPCNHPSSYDTMSSESTPVSNPTQSSVNMPDPVRSMGASSNQRAVTSSTLPSTFTRVDDESYAGVFRKAIANEHVPRIYPILTTKPSSSISTNQISNSVSESNNLYPHELRQLTSMGFNENVSRYMLLLHKGDINAAVNDILRS